MKEKNENSRGKELKKGGKGERGRGGEGEGRKEEKME